MKQVPTDLFVTDRLGEPLTEVGAAQIVSFNVNTNHDQYMIRVTGNVFILDQRGIIRPVNNLTFNSSHTRPQLFIPPLENDYIFPLENISIDILHCISYFSSSHVP